MPGASRSTHPETAHNRDGGQASSRPAARPRWHRAKPVVTAVFMLLVLGLVVRHATQVDWPQVMQALYALSPRTVGLAGMLVVISYAIYCAFDLIGRHQTGHSLSPARVMAICFVSYAFNLNFGALIGGVAFRYRLYSRHGLSTAVITQVLGLSVLTNWLGYLLVAGLIFLLRPPALPGYWPLSTGSLRILGVVLLTAVAVYLLLCARARRRSWCWRQHRFSLPTGRVALLQLLLSSSNWLLTAGIVYLLLDQRLSYSLIVGVFLTAAIAGTITHIPAGLGVLEAVFITLLGHRIALPTLLAALLAYRALYYLAPLCIAAPFYAFLEARAKREGRTSEAAQEY